MSDPWQFWLDVGGTFTDCVALGPDGAPQTRKVLSSGAVKGRCGDGSTGERIIDPDRADDPPDFYRGWSLRLLDENGAVVERRTVASFDPDQAAIRLDRPAEAVRAGRSYELTGGGPAPVVAVRRMMGLRPDEPIGPVRVRLGTTRGTNALLERKGAAVGFVTTAGFGDLLKIGTQARPELFSLKIDKPPPLHHAVAEVAERIDAAGNVLEPLDEAEAERALIELRDAGCTTLAVCLINAYTNDAHERLIRRVAERVGFAHISVSTELTPTIKALDRGDTAVVDAHLSPVIRGYVDELRAAMPEARLTLMSSAGGLVDAERFAGKDSLLSGPAGGVVGLADVAQRAGCVPAIGFDMGGTSSDVSRYSGEFEYRFADEMAGVRIVAPAYAIETVAAGGGSICHTDGERLLVGPRSAGAEPGPACYGRGGPLTVTDLNVYTGRIDTERFPFPLDTEAVDRRLGELAGQVRAAGSGGMAPQRIAEGLLAVANEKMAGPIRRLSAARGYDPAEHTLVAFGGAAPQHACALGRLLGLRRVLLHPMAGILSAYGIGMADVRRFDERSVLAPLSDETLAELQPRFEHMAERLGAQIAEEGVAAERIDPPKMLLDLRYAGQRTAITVEAPDDGDWMRAFVEAHRRLYGHAQPGREVEVATLRCERVGRTPKPDFPEAEPVERFPQPRRRQAVRFDGASREAGLFHRADLRPGDVIDGPALVSEPYSAVFVEPGWRAEVSRRYELKLRDTAEGLRREAVSMERDPVRLELFNNHFTHIATRMGVTLQRTALSVNVKERLDFSCAILDAAGNLVVNAPHIPVHLGAMGESVKGLLRTVGDIRPGDVYLSNDPDLGGSHLPDLTAITPVFDEAGERLRFFAASRAHHAEIGGLRPGSAFPFARNLAEEGVVLRNLRVMREGTFDEEALRRALAEADYPSRSPDQNVADVRAQIAANRVGAAELEGVIERFTWPVVEAYMGHIRDAAEAVTRRTIAELEDGTHRFADALDDGSPLALALRVDGESITADLTGTGPVNDNSLNANRAVVQAALMYCLRCLIGRDIPLNWGMMGPLELVLPPSMLNPPAADDPRDHAAVVAGNVELSQRVVDLVFGALGVCAASQGTMNNFVFGNERFGYYETICGGAGAGPTFDGTDAVHTHMTNTRLTDVEVMEREHPVRVRRFAVRRGSGGSGASRGGAGVVRTVEFLEPMEVSIVSQRRSVGPFALRGGGPGRPGRNTLHRRGGTEQHLDGLAQVDVEAGDAITIETPGGGGFGANDE